MAALTKHLEMIIKDIAKIYDIPESVVINDVQKWNLKPYGYKSDLKAPPERLKKNVDFVINKWVEDMQYRQIVEHNQCIERANNPRLVGNQLKMRLQYITRAQSISERIGHMYTGARIDTPYTLDILRD